MKNVSAIVLAAGMSKRMGTLKQLVKIGDQTLLETTLNALLNSAVYETILVLGFQAEQITNSMKIPSSVKIVRNDLYEQGMSTSIRAGIASVSTEANAALIVLADQPLIKPAILNAIIDEYHRTGAAILLPVYKGFRGNPVLIDRALFPEMTQITGDIGCRSLFGLHADQIHKLPVDDIGVLIDIDSPEDLQKISAGEMINPAQEDDRAVSLSQRLLIVGQDEVARALVKLAKVLNFHVTMVDPLLSRKEVPEADEIINDLNLRTANATHIVVASRGKYDEEALQQALATPAAYVALLGSKKRGSEIIQRLLNRGIAEEELKRIRCPAGLELHAETPEEIALSILAEIVCNASVLRAEPETKSLPK